MHKRIISTIRSSIVLVSVLLLIGTVMLFSIQINQLIQMKPRLNVIVIVMRHFIIIKRNVIWMLKVPTN